MKTIILVLVTVCSSLAFAAPKYVDCTNASSVLTDQGLGPGGFGITHRFPEPMVVVQDFLYSKDDEDARMKVIVDGSIYRVAADCRQKINNGVLCKFDLTLETKGSFKPTDAAPLTDYMKRLNAAVIDKDLDSDEFSVSVGMDDKSDIPSHPLPFHNMISFNNDAVWGVNNCEAKDFIEQG